MLIRVKTSDDADELEKLLNEKKKAEWNSIAPHILHGSIQKTMFDKNAFWQTASVGSCLD